MVAVRGVEVVDISSAAPTMRDLCEAPEPAGLAHDAAGEPIGTLDDILANTPREKRDPAKPWLLSPVDLQAIKAAGVTFAVSMLERVIEERTHGAPEHAAEVRAEIGGLIGHDLAKLKPGSPEAMALKDLLIDKGMWSQYLEVGIGPDAEIFTKAPPMAAVGHLAEVGIHPMSSWNNPEPEVVLVAVLDRRRSSAPRSATTSTCATSRAAPLCSSARPRTTMPAARSGPSSASSATASRSTTSATPR